MRGRPCLQEDAVLAAALEAPRAPLTPDLAAHLADCDSCRDLHTIASALQDDQAEALAEARVPSAGQAWWRAELRARQEATAVATRPITVATGLAAACLVGLLASVAGVLSWWLRDWLVMPAGVQSVAAGLGTAAESAPTSLRLALWLVAGVLLVATPVMLYVATRDE